MQNKSGKIISIFTNKGGVGKTTSAISLAHGFAKQKYKTLLIDADAQCNATEVLVRSTNPAGNIMELIQGQKKIEDCIHLTDIDVNLSCIPSSEDLTDIEPELIRRGEAAFGVLHDQVVDYCKKNYEITIIDCPPNFGIFVINALFCSNLSIVPTESGSRNSIRGLTSAQKFIYDINQAGNQDLFLFKVLVTKLDKRTIIGREYVNHIKETFRDKCFTAHIPACIDFKYAEDAKQTIFQNNVKSAGAKGYRQVVREIIEAFNGHQTTKEGE